MIYCEREKGKYVDQEEKCIHCIFYKVNEDSCTYSEWHPGLKGGRDESNS